MAPVLGIVIGSGMNKVLTQRVGDRASRDLRTRRDLVRGEGRAPKAVKARAPKKKIVAKKKAPKKPKLAVVSS